MNAVDTSTTGTKSDTRWVLIVEDDDEIRQILRDCIELEADTMPLKIIEARNGLEALGETSQRQFHCVVTDLKMPLAGGDELIRGMQAQTLNANTPTLVVSAHAKDDFREFCSQYSHIRVIPKPFIPSSVAQTVLREIKLGRMDDRIAIHLMNPFLESLRDFLNAEIKLSCVLSQPEVKRAGNQLMGDLHCTATLTTGVSRGRFTFSFERGVLDWLKVNFYKRRVSELASLSHEDVALYLIQSVFEKASAQIQFCMGGSPRLVGLAMVTPKQEVERANLSQTTGVMVSIHTAHGKMFAGALSRPSAVVKRI